MTEILWHGMGNSIYYFVFYGGNLLNLGLSCAPGGIHAKIACIGHVG